MPEQPGERSEYLDRVESDKRIRAEYRIQRRMIFFGDEYLKLKFRSVFHVATSARNTRALQVQNP